MVLEPPAKQAMAIDTALRTVVYGITRDPKEERGFVSEKGKNKSSQESERAKRNHKLLCYFAPNPAYSTTPNRRLSASRNLLLAADRGVVRVESSGGERSSIRYAIQDDWEGEGGPVCIVISTGPSACCPTICLPQPSTTPTPRVAETTVNSKKPNPMRVSCQRCCSSSATALRPPTTPTTPLHYVLPCIYTSGKNAIT